MAWDFKSTNLLRLFPAIIFVFFPLGRMVDPEQFALPSDCRWATRLGARHRFAAGNKIIASRILVLGRRSAPDPRSAAQAPAQAQQQQQ